MFLREQDTKTSYKTFTLPTTQTKTKDKGCKIRPIINHLNESFWAVCSNESEQSIDGYMGQVKFVENSL